MNYLRRLNNDYLFPYKWQFMLIVITGFFADLLLLADPYILKVVFDEGFLGHDYSIVYIFVALAVVIKLVMNVIMAYRSHLVSAFNSQVTKDMSVDFYNHLQSLDLAYFKTIQIGELIRVAIVDIQFLAGNLAHCYTNVLRSSLQLLIFGTVIFMMNLKLALVGLIVIPLFIWSKQYFEKRILPAMKQRMFEEGELNSFYKEHISGMRVVQECCAENFILDKLKQRLKSINGLLLKYTLNSNYNVVTTSFLYYLGPIIVLCYGGVLMFKGEITIGELLAFFYIVGNIYQPIQIIIFRSVRIKEAKIWAARFYQQLDVQPEIIDKADAKTLVYTDGEISFDNIDFRHENGQPILKNFNMQIAAGETVALVGKSGTGKSTISNLLYRFLEPQNGTVKIDSENIQNFTLQSLRAQLGIVSQDSVMFHTSILANLQLAAENLTEAEIVTACQSARIHDFIEVLPQKYQTIVGEKGVKLSGGEKQRLALARTLLRNPKILILDEASSHLDNQNEKEIFADLLNLKADRTTLIIAHRLTTVQNCDRICVLTDGKIAESGSFEELLAKKELFYQLWQHDQRLNQHSSEVAV